MRVLLLCVYGGEVEEEATNANEENNSSVEEGVSDLFSL